MDLQPVRGGEHLKHNRSVHHNADSLGQGDQVDVSQIHDLNSSEFKRLMRVIGGQKK